VLALAAVAALAVFAVSGWRAGRVQLVFVAGDRAVPPLELTVYSDRLSYALPSPPPAFGTVAVEGEGATLDRSLVPGRAAVRYRGEGVGAGVVYVELGHELPPIALEAPRTIRGRVVVPRGIWCFGWRWIGSAPVADAEVVAMAGGQQGIDLAATQTDVEGRFVLGGVAPSVHPLSLRVRALGCSIAHVEVPAAQDDRGEDVVAALRRTTAVRGMIAAPPGVALPQLCILARGLPGVQVHPAADGSFLLDHIPAQYEPWLVVHGLGPFLCCPEMRAKRQGEVRLEVMPAGVIRGCVVDDFEGRGLAGAHVYSADGAAAQTDAAGEFELEHVLPGRVVVTAQWQPPRLPRQRPGPERIGRCTVELGAGQILDGVNITVVKR
jgi:hypothetical protein